MKRSQAISLSVLLFGALGPPTFAGGGSDAFPATDLMRIGVYYYPEAWPSNQWARDIANIKKLNLEFVHLGEFAWAFMEPTEGKFHFDWLERNVQLCAEQGLKVVLCTPSPTPPAWLAQNHPEILMVDAKGRKMLHGTRQQACWSVQTYRDFVGRIVDELGMGHILKSYRALKRVGAPVDVITEEKDFSQYPFLVVPAGQLVDEQLVQRWKNYAGQGGHLILTCRTAQKDRRGHLWEGPWAAPILDLIGAKIKFYDTLPAPNSGRVKAGRRTYDWVSWAEVLEPNADTTIVAKHVNQFYAGQPAAVTRKLGKGSVTYLGVDSVNGGLEAQLVRDVFARAGVSVENLADGFLVDWRDGFWIATNFTEKARRAPIPRNAKILVGWREVPTAGVTVWQE